MNYPLKMYSGPRYIMISTTSSLGSRSYFISVAYLVIGGLSIMISIIFLLILIFCPRQYGGVEKIFSKEKIVLTSRDQKSALSLHSLHDRRLSDQMVKIDMNFDS